MSADELVQIGEIWELKVSEGPFLRQQAQEALRLAVAHLTKAGYPGRDGWVQAGQDDPFPHGSLEWVAVQLAEAACTVSVLMGHVPEMLKGLTAAAAVEGLAEMAYQLGYYRAMLRTMSEGPDGSFLDFAKTGGGMRRAKGARKVARQKQAADKTARRYGDWACRTAADLRSRNPDMSRAQLVRLIRGRYDREQPEGVTLPTGDEALDKTLADGGF